MVDVKYARAYTEVLELIKHLCEKDQMKIPNEKIQFYEQNKMDSYSFVLDPNKELQEQNISKEASAIILKLFMDYFANDSQKRVLSQILMNNKIIEEREKGSFNDNLFDKKKLENEIVKSEPLQMVEYKENIFIKIKKIIFKILHIK